jgi:hypothetical protein
LALTFAFLEQRLDHNSDVTKLDGRDAVCLNVLQASRRKIKLLKRASIE